MLWDLVHILILTTVTHFFQHLFVGKLRMLLPLFLTQEVGSKAQVVARSRTAESRQCLTGIRAAVLGVTWTC